MKLDLKLPGPPRPTPGDGARRLLSGIAGAAHGARQALTRWLG